MNEQGNEQEKRFAEEWLSGGPDCEQEESNLGMSNSLLDRIINGIPDVLAIQNPDFTIVRYNRAGYQLLGITPGEIKNQKCYELLGRNEKCDQCATHRALQTKKLEQAERYIPELGIYLDCRSNPVLDDDGNVIQIIALLRDITGHKQLETRLKEKEAIENYIALKQVV